MTRRPTRRCDSHRGCASEVRQLQREAASWLAYVVYGGLLGALVVGATWLHAIVSR